jgi:hypothetical protein
MFMQTTTLPPPEFPLLAMATSAIGDSTVETPRRSYVVVVDNMTPAPSASKAAFRTATEPPWLDALATRLERLRDLAAGWDGPGSIPTKGWLLIEATQLVKDALAGSNNATAPFLVPGGDGSLQIEWHARAGEIELDLSPDGRRSIWVHDRLTGEELEGEDDRALTLFSRWAPRYSSIADDAPYVSNSANTSIFGAIAGLSIYQDDSIT